MSNTDKIILELSNDLGFEFKEGKLITIIGGSDRQQMRDDIRKIGMDMRNVLARRNG